MKSSSVCRLLLGLALATLAIPLAAQTTAAPPPSSNAQGRSVSPATPRPQPPPPPVSPFLPGFWWRDYRRTLGLTEEQSKQIDTVVQSHMTVFREKASNLRGQEEELSRLITTEASEGVIARQADRVEELRALLNKNRTLMLVRVRAVLTPEQRAKLTTLREQWEHDNQRPGGERGRQGDDRRPPNQRQDPPRAR